MVTFREKLSALLVAPDDSEPESPIPRIITYCMVAGIVISALICLWPQIPPMVVIQPDPSYFQQAQAPLPVVVAQGPDTYALVNPVTQKITQSIPSHAKSAGKDLPLGPIDINRATQADLEKLPGVGPKLAQRILSYRKQNGPFAQIDALQNVSGIGPKKYLKLAPYCKL